MASLLATEWLMVLVWFPSTVASLTAVTVTVWAVLKSEDVKITVPGLTTVWASGETVMVTSAEGEDPSTKV